MGKNEIKKIVVEYLPRYKSEGVNASLIMLLNIAEEAATGAKINYAKLKEPKSCPADIYIHYWTRETLERGLATKSLKPISLDNPPPSFRASAKYYWHLPPELHRPLVRKLFDAKPENREAVWNNFGLSYKEIEKCFIGMAIERAGLARNKGYSSYIDMFLDKFKIPGLDYESCIKNINILLDYCAKQLPKTGSLPRWFYSEFNLPCYICRISPFPFKAFDEVSVYIAKEYAILGKFKNKIVIKLGEKSKMFYKKESDSFEITIGKYGNTRHQVADLIHELSHVIDYLQHFSKGINPFEIGSYSREKEAAIIELAILRESSTPLYHATFGEILLLFRRLLFEIELYKNPDQDLAQLYAETFNRCFKEAKQKKNRLYFLDERISLEPLSTLPHAIAQSEIILDLINKGRVSKDVQKE